MSKYLESHLPHHSLSHNKTNSDWVSLQIIELVLLDPYIGLQYVMISWGIPWLSCYHGTAMKKLIYVIRGSCTSFERNNTWGVLKRNMERSVLGKQGKAKAKLIDREEQG